MDDNTPQITPQKRRKDAANYYAEGDMKVINNYYPPEENEVIIITIDYAQIVLVFGIMVLAGIMLWVSFNAGLGLYNIWLWLVKNWRFILAGFIPISVVIGATLYWFVTYSKDTTDKDLFV